MANETPHINIYIVCTSRRLGLYRVDEVVSGRETMLRSPCPYAQAREYADHWAGVHREAGCTVSVVDEAVTA